MLFTNLQRVLHNIIAILGTKHNPRIFHMNHEIYLLLEYTISCWILSILVASQQDWFKACLIVEDYHMSDYPMRFIKWAASLFTMHSITIRQSMSLLGFHNQLCCSDHKGNIQNHNKQNIFNTSPHLGMILELNNPWISSKLHQYKPLNISQKDQNLFTKNVITTLL